ncbi:MAG: NAD(P)/FAD-dependent oxidoreductase [Candidatus Dormibacteraceae bacterium]
MIAILGGGVAGASLAWALTAAGHRDVTVFDPRARGAGSTSRALGGFRTQQGSLLNTELSLASREFFVALGERIGFRSCGYLYLAENEAVALDLQRRAARQREWGIPVEHPDPRTLAPFLDLEGVAGANFCALDGVYAPTLVLAAFIEAAGSAGAEFRYETEPPAGVIDAAEAVVVCCGAWSREVGESLGVTLEVTPWERGVYQVGPFGWLTGSEPMVLEAGSGYHFRERDRRLLVMFPDDPGTWEGVRDWLRMRVPAAAVDEPEAHWSGAYEVTPDHHPLVGETRRARLWASCGFSGHGVMHSPAVARSLAAMILGLTPPMDLMALSPLRETRLRDATQL